MFWLFTQMFVLCAGAFLAGVLLTWLAMRPKPEEPEVFELPEFEVDFAVKASSKTMIFHTPASPYYNRMKGDMSFSTAEEAEQAGYTMWVPRTRVKAAS